ncbi:hypothetical protein [Streptomyces erythrochromogenes]|uniref:hypothetical protein n=1 Tax=Streptomyces erythrochromogenes TaxID=285574 RepID=UPI0036C7B068
MTSPTPRGVWSLDIPDSPSLDFAAVCRPSPELLARAQAGFARFNAAGEAESDE